MLEYGQLKAVRKGWGSDEPIAIPFKVNDAHAMQLALESLVQP